ncbi:MAG: hypothetical protein V2G51_08025 [bacterium JZ-2024 1]
MDPPPPPQATESPVTAGTTAGRMNLIIFHYVPPSVNRFELYVWVDLFVQHKAGSASFTCAPLNVKRVGSNPAG